MTAIDPHVGVGLYSIAAAARLTGAHAETVRRWLSEKEGIVPQQFREEKLLTFQELMEIHFIQMFRDEDLSFQTIRRASGRASVLFNTPYPFTVKRFDTDGATVFATLIKEERGKAPLVEDLVKGQYVFRNIVRPFFRKLEYRHTDKSVARFWPMEKKGRVVLDPQRKFGKPIDAESGVPTRIIYDALNAGEEGQQPSDVARWLGIPLAAVNAAAKFERSIAA